MAQGSDSSEGKVAIVTGASSGIGRAIALTLARSGWRLTLNARRRNLLQTLVREIEDGGGAAITVPDNLTEFGAHERVIGDTVSTFGRLDLLVNNAGIAGSGAIDEVQDETYDDCFKLNVWAPIALMRAAVPHFKEAGGGQVINIGSIVGYVPSPKGSVYAASKWALRGLTESWREELYPFRIKVAYVAPGYVVTEFGGRTAVRLDDVRDWAMVPEDVAHVVHCIATQGPNSDIREVTLQVVDRS